MSDYSVIFYEIDSSFLDIVLKLSEKICEKGENALLLCQDEEEVKFFDSKLWTYSKLSFLPHGSSFSHKSDEADYCNIWISDKIEFLNKPSSLVHNGLDLIDEKDVSKFNKIIDIYQKDERNAAIKRGTYYKKIGFTNQTVWKKEKDSWTSAEF